MIFWWNLRALRPSIDNKGPYTIKVQKCGKEIGKIIHVSSGLRLLDVSVAPFWRISGGCKLRTHFCISQTVQISLLHIFSFWFEWKQHILYAANIEECTQFPASGIFSKMELGWHGIWIKETIIRRRIWIKSLFFYFAHKKYSCSFVKLRFYYFMLPRFWTLIV